MKNFLHFNFLPRSADFALLVLRLAFAGALFWLHGRGKLTGFSEMAPKFPDPLGIGHQASLALAVLGEVVCALLLVIGAFTRLAALGAAITMGVAFFLVHDGKLSGQGGGELAFVYLAAFAALFLAGAGRFSVDSKLGAKA